MLPSVNASFTFESMLCKPKRGSCTSLWGESKCGSLSTSTLTEPHNSEPTSHQGYLASVGEKPVVGFLRGALSFDLCFNTQGLRFYLEGRSLPVLHALLLDVVTTATHGQVSLGKLGGELLSAYGGNLIFLAADMRIS